MSKLRTFEQALREAADELAAAGVPEAELNARYLLEEVTGRDHAWFLLHGAESLPEDQSTQYDTLVEHRKKRVPLEYLIHRAEFMGLSFYVDGRVLIPRQDTECLVEEALKYADGADILDMCTGSGCIAVSLAVLGKPKSVTASDISVEALAVAGENAKRNDAAQLNDEDIAWRDAEDAGKPHHTSVEFIHSNLYESITGSYDLITCNPPYIRRDVIPTLMPEVQEYEPVLALDGGEDGLDLYRRIVGECGAFLRQNGHLICEIGYDQGEAVAALMREAGLADVQVKQDLAGLNRIVIGRKE